ncbi:expressed unknown protein [Seminavis robusta]|uniref:DUF1801 domain-containing protein n=1 Tax=Seminavis robusta TaxID=568900 RepID=A0A9N8HL02_9STRA|nr:expressed unknown protein [Seminavis robusta]|eukprot:Sro877_g214600.1 n/a (188) ;mRNA; f:7063-7626
MVTLRPRKAKEEAAAPAAKKGSTVKHNKKKAPAKPKPQPSATEAGDDSSLQEFLTTKVPDESKHEDITWLYHAIQTRAPDCPPELQGTATLAFGGFDYETKSKCSGRWSRMSIMVNKTGLTFMVSGMKDGKYLLEHFDKKQIGRKVSLGKSCIRFASLETVHRSVLEEIIQAAAEATISPVATSSSS